MLRGPIGLDPNMSREGLHFASVAAVTDVDAVTTLDSYFINAQNRQPIVGFGYGEAVNYRVLEDMPGITEVASVIYIGLLRNNIHWINTDDGLPLHFTDAVYQLVKKYNFEENVPMHTPAMGVPRTSRQSTTTEIAKLRPLTQSFRIDGEVYARKFDSIQVIASLAAAANGINSSNARNAYGAILFGKSVSPLTPPSSNTNAELLFRAAEESSLFAIFHKRRDAFSYLAQRARVVMQTSPSRSTPNVAIIPFGKMSALSSNAFETQYWLAGSIGPKRIKNGQPSDVDTGMVLDGDGTVLKKDGVEIREAPMVSNFDTSVDQMSRRVYLGGIELFSPPSMASFGAKNGKGYGNGLPWCKRYSPEKDTHSIISFETLVERCGWFKKVPGAGVNGDMYNQDISKHLWCLDQDSMRRVLPNDPATLQNIFPEANLNQPDPFFVYGNPPAGGAPDIVPRPKWSPRKTRYIDDINGFWEIEHISNEDIDAASRMTVPGGAAFNINDAGDWPYLKWDVERKMRRNSRHIQHNYNIAMMDRAAVTALLDGFTQAAQVYFNVLLAAGGAPLDVRDVQVPQVLPAAGAAQEQIDLFNAWEGLRNTLGDGHIGRIDGAVLAIGAVARTYGDIIDQANDRVERIFDQSPQSVYCDERRQMEMAGNVAGMTLSELAEHVDFLLMSPMQEYYMQDVAFIRSGAELGKTFMSHPTINVGHDVMVNDWKWVIQYRAEAVVINPDLVTVFRNVIYDGMGTGNNSEVMTFDEARALQDSGFELQEGMASIIAIPIPKISKPVGINGMDNVDGSRTIFALSGTLPAGGQNGQVKPHYPGFKLCNQLFGWNRVNVVGLAGQTTYPIAPLLFRGALVWPTENGEMTEECHDHHGLGTVGARDVRMYGRSLNPTATG